VEVCRGLARGLDRCAGVRDFWMRWRFHGLGSGGPATVFMGVLVLGPLSWVFVGGMIWGCDGLGGGGAFGLMGGCFAVVFCCVGWWGFFCAGRGFLGMWGWGFIWFLRLIWFGGLCWVRCLRGSDFPGWSVVHLGGVSRRLFGPGVRFWCACVLLSSFTRLFVFFLRHAELALACGLGFRSVFLVFVVASCLSVFLFCFWFCFCVGCWF